MSALIPFGTKAIFHRWASLVVLLLYASNFAHAQTATPSCITNEIATLNGVFVFPEDAQSNSDALELYTRPSMTAQENSVTHFRFIYNDTGGIADVLEVLVQSRGLSSADFWFALGGTKEFPSYVQDFFDQLGHQSVFDANAVDPATPNRIIAESHAIIASGRRMVLVAHSQGNLYSNSVAKASALTPSERLSWATVNVAVPDEEVNGSITGYTTLVLDGVINPIDTIARSLLLLHPPLLANVDDGYINPFARILNHSFTASYLASEPSRSTIVQNTLTTMRALTVPSGVSCPGVPRLPPYTIVSGDVIEIDFSFNNIFPFSGTPNSLIPALYQSQAPGQIGPAVGLTAALYDGTQALGSYSSTSVNGILGPPFYSSSSFLVNFYGPGGIIDFASIASRTIVGRFVLSITSGSFVYDPRVTAFPGTAQEAKGSVVILADGCGFPCSIYGYGAVSSVKLNGTMVYP